VLIRALEPVEGLDLMRARRAGPVRDARRVVAEAGLCRGPGNVGRALGISLAENQMPLSSGRLTIREGDDPRPVVWTPRVGVGAGGERYWRCVVRESAAVSGPRAHLAAGVAAPHPPHGGLRRDGGR
jgi:DNA-3-methyladenine glycosylase